MPRTWAVVIRLVTVGLLPIGYASAAKTSYDLRPQSNPGEVVRVEAQLEVGGEVKLAEEGKTRSLKMSVAGKLVYDEKGLSVRRTGMTDGTRTVRYYHDAQAVIKIDEGGMEPKLRDDRRFVVADEMDGRATLFSPAGPLTREELDLIDLPANSLLVDRLLPDQPVRVGDHWDHSDALVGELLGLDAVSRNDTRSELKEVAGNRARLELSGRVLGAIGGVATEIEVKAKYRFDFNERRVTGIGLLVKEKRAIGHVNTGLDVVAKLQMALAPAEGDTLSDRNLAGLSLEPRIELLALECPAPNKKFRIYHGRDWHLMTDAGDTLALRYLQRGDLVAQCNVSSLADVEPGKEPSLATFQHDLERSLGESFERYVEASESTTSAGHHIYRIVADGHVSNLAIQWHYFLVADRAGRLAVFAFTVEPDLLEKLGDADEALVSTIEFAPPPTSGKPTQAAGRRGTTKR